MPNAKISIRTCAFQCGSCNNDYFSCASCRDTAFSILPDSQDSNCYPINQTIKGYIYNSTTEKFEKCYKSCDFCTLNKEESSSSQHNCKICAEGFSPSYNHMGNCYEIDEYEKDKEIFSITDNSFTLTSCDLSSQKFKIASTGECISICPNSSTYYYINNYTYNNFTEQEFGSFSPILSYELYLEKPPKYSFGNLCYKECPSNTEIDTENNKCICKFAWHKTSDGKIFCYEEDYCIYNEYRYYLDDTKECKNDGCPENYFQFNFQCYKTGCPSEISIISSTETNKCESIYNFCYIDKYYKNICSEIQNENFTLKFDNTVQYLKSCEESVNYTTSGKKTYLYNGICYITCPDETISDTENDICKCKYYGYYPENNYYICYNEIEKCQSKIPVIDLRICLDEINDCISKGYKILNDECYNESCPEYTHLDDNGYTCLCSYFYYVQDSNLNCFNSSEISCEEKGFSFFNPITKECFNSLDDCFNKNNKYHFNNNCYKDGCPEGTSIIGEDIYNCTCEKSYYFNETINKIICINKEENESEFYSGNVESEKYLDSKVISSESIYIEVDSKISSSGSLENEISSENMENEMSSVNMVNEINNDVFEIKYPQEYYDNPDKCLAIYENKCYSKCPENTCLTQRDINLIYCVDVEPGTTVFNDICFNNIEEIVQNIKNYTEANILISPMSGINIGVYTKDSKNSFNSSFSVIFLNECEELLIQNYNLSPDTKLYILGIETPDKNSKSSVNVYNYRIYLENGTELEYSSICEGVKVSISSIISNEELIKLKDAIYFSRKGYDIYNLSSEFYTSVCSSASMNNCDITLTDRNTDFYPSKISMCNDSCKLNYINLNSKRIECNCDIGYNFSENDNEVKRKEIEEVDLNFFEYFLTFINYKIFKCYELFLKPKKIFTNIGFYVGTIIILISLLNLFIFTNLGMFSLNSIIKENEPNRLKIKQMVKEEEEKRKKLLNLFYIKNNNINENKTKNKKVSSLFKKRAKGTKNPKYPPKKREDSYSDNGKLAKIRIFIKANKKKKKAKGRAKLDNIFQLKNKLKKKIKFKKNSLKSSEKGLNFELISTISKNDSLSNKYLKLEKSNYVQIAKPIKIKNIIFPELIKDTESIYKEKKIELINIPNYQYLIKLKEKEIDEKELNEVPYYQALRMDNRPFYLIVFYILANKIEIINIFFYNNPYVHISISITIYLFSILLDVFLNCFLYTDDVVSEKYHNDGNLKFATSLLLSIMSNIFSSIISYIIEVLLNYSNFFEAIIKETNMKKYYYRMIIKFKKYMKIKVSIFFTIVFILSLLMTYYITIFCIIYQTTQVNIMINYILGIGESISISLGITFIISILRILSIKNKWRNLYYTSRFLYQKF